jgi:hypothetical protein
MVAPEALQSTAKFLLPQLMADIPIFHLGVAEVAVVVGGSLEFRLRIL